MRRRERAESEDGEEITDTTQILPEAPKIEIFIDYAREDEKFLRELEAHLRLLELPGLTVWHTGKIVAGMPWQQEINTHLTTASIILLLVSVDFFASEEAISLTKQAMERSKQQSVRVIPVLLRWCAWQDSILGDLAPLPANGRPIDDWTNRNDAYREVIKDIRQVVEELRTQLQSNTSLLQGKKEYDVFLYYDSKDRAAVKRIAEQLRERGIAPWFNEWEFRPGMPWRREVEAQIEQITAIAVFVGKNAMESWRQIELDTLVEQFEKRKCPIIPVLLTDAPERVELPPVLEVRHHVDFRRRTPDPIEQLIWGITGKRDVTENRTFSNGYALLVGVGEDLPVAARDVVALHSMLVDPTRAAYPPSQVQLLSDSLATRQNILDALDWLHHQVSDNPDATVLVYFSGQGVRVISSDWTDGVFSRTLRLRCKSMDRDDNIYRRIDA